MYHVYILTSQKDSKRIYIGYTKDLENRIDEHNRGESKYSKIYAPWKLETHVAFSSEKMAVAFERYLKSGSGFAFLKKRLLPRHEPNMKRPA